MTGKVIYVNGSSVKVRLECSAGACATCKSPCAQAAMQKRKKDAELYAKNTAGAKVGDTVICSDDAGLGTFPYLVLCFIVPIASAVAAYLIASRLSEGARLLCALGGFAVSLIAAGFLCSFLSRRFPSVEITKIVEDGESAAEE